MESLLVIRKQSYIRYVELCCTIRIYFDKQYFSRESNCGLSFSIKYLNNVSRDEIHIHHNTSLVKIILFKI